MKRLDCGCEVNANTLVSLCEAHAEFYRLRSNSSGTAAPVKQQDRKLRDELLVALAPVIAARAKRGEGFGEIADAVTLTVDAIMHRVT